MKRIIPFLFAAFMFIGFTGVANAQNTFDQDVTIVLSDINVLSVSTSSVSMTINTATAGSAPTDATHTSSSYAVTTNGTTKKLTGILDADYASGLTLNLDLDAPSGGSSSAKDLSSTAQDLVTNFGQLAESSLTISYTASATVSASPNGAGETNQVTITLTDV